MTKWVGGFFIVFLMLSQAMAIEPGEALKDPDLEARARVLSLELRCMVCQNQSIDDSDAPLAGDLRMLVRERLLVGDSDEQIFELVTARYGDFVLLRPPVVSRTLFLWFAPFLIFAVGLFTVWRLIRRSK
ncbi:cytochrome c-type biogenesis protein CcmH [Alphaproteobacteria bacterium]|jgi:cytochrome c-type biogenesis protein CcmH|nr:cytochrome c-type biogenesis protein CcmH [Alphaproteobacteria bacterium]